MKAFLLAAGLGLRLRPFTDETPKCLLPIAGVPLLSIWLELCARHGVRDVLINLHHRPERVMAFLGRYAGPVVVRAVHEERLVGTAGTVRDNWDFVSGERDFLVLYADNLTNADLGELVRAHRTAGGPLTIGLFCAPSPESCGIVELDGSGVVASFVEKPRKPRSNLASAGIYVAGPELRSFLPPEGLGDFGFDVLPRLVGRARGRLLEAFVRDIGTPEGYRLAQEEWTALMRAGQGPPNFDI